MTVFYILIFFGLILLVWAVLFHELKEIIKHKKFNTISRITIISISILFLILFHIYVIHIILYFNPYKYGNLLNGTPSDWIIGVILGIMDFIVVIIVIMLPLIIFYTLNAVFTIWEERYRDKYNK
jgi:hypothetical protein